MIDPISIFVAGILVGAVASSMFVVRQQTIGIIERFGRYNRVVHPGLNFKVPLIDRVAARVNMRVQQLDVSVETKTFDNVFVKVMVSVQFTVRQDRVYEAYYKLNDIHTQVTAFVFDVVRARVPLLTLDDVFSKKDDIAIAVKEELQLTIGDFGYSIVKTLVTDIDPDAKVKQAMNEINYAMRMRQAAAEKGEADRILKVKAAEAEAESMALQGRGMADQRKHIIEGLRDSVEEFQNVVDGTTAKEVMMLVLMTQYFDTLREVASHSQSNTIMLPGTPAGAFSLADQLREAMLSVQNLPTQPSPKPETKK